MALGAGRRPSRSHPELITEATAGEVQRYILEGSDEELRRLLSVSEVTAGAARRAFGLYAGVPRGNVDGLPFTARAAGLETASADGFFILGEPELSLEIPASTLAAPSAAGA